MSTFLEGVTLAFLVLNAVLSADRMNRRSSYRGLDSVTEFIYRWDAAIGWATAALVFASTRT